jgi:hypothetical protein
MVTYRGEKFSGYNKPKRTSGAKKKSAVLVKKGGKVQLVRFGDPKLSIKKDQPAREHQQHLQRELVEPPGLGLLGCLHLVQHRLDAGKTG